MRPLISGKSRWMNYYNLSGMNILFIQLYMKNIYLSIWFNVLFAFISLWGSLLTSRYMMECHKSLLWLCEETSKKTNLSEDVLAAKSPILQGFTASPKQHSQNSTWLETSYYVRVSFDFVEWFMKLKVVQPTEGTVFVWMRRADHLVGGHQQPF